MSTDFGFLTASDLQSVSMNGTIGSVTHNDFLTHGTGNDFLTNGVTTDLSPTAAEKTTDPAPGAPGKSDNNNVLDYNEAFPALGGGKGAAAPQGNAWVNKPARRPIGRMVVTQVFHIPAEERREDNSFGKPSQLRECDDIMQKTNTKIELCESKDHSLTVLIEGERHAIEEARKQIVQRIQQQAYRDIRIPKDHHRILIGREGKKLADLERATACRIQIPGRDEASELIRITGPREGIEAAVHHIQVVSDEQSKLAQEHLIIPRHFYPWIKGPNNETVDALKQRTGARINIPPPSAQSEIIVITGEKEGVYEAAAEVRRIHEEKAAKCQSLVIPLAKTQHKYVIGQGGSGLAEILRETDVSVEVPPPDADEHNVTLRGEADKLGLAVTMVYAKGSSVLTQKIECPAWLHKFIIGTRGANIKQVVGEPPIVQVDFGDDDDADCILIEGKPDEVRTVKQALTELVDKLKLHYATVTLHIAPNLHRHIIGRAGSNIQKIKEQTGVLVNIPDESTNSDEIRLEGPKEGVAQASLMIREIATRMENERSRDILIEQRFHSHLIGAKGAGVQGLREKYPGVNVSFPEPGRKSDIVTLRGPKDEVDALHKELQAKAKKLVEDNFQVKVHIYKDFHGAIIGKGGANLRKIRDETDTRVDIPPEGSNTDVVVITGKRPNAEKAAEMLQKIQNELASIVTLDLTIPNRVHASLLYGGGKLIHSIQDECGGTQIKFPGDGKGDKVTIRGPKEEAERARVLLTQLAKDKELSSHKVDVRVRAELHRFLIGSGGQSIRKIRDQFPDVRILFPRPNTADDKDAVHLIGRKEDVEKVKVKLEAMAADLEKIVEKPVDIDPKYHPHFFARQFAVLKDVQEECGGVVISFPRRAKGGGQSPSATVTVKGAPECVDAAIERLKGIADDLAAQVKTSIQIPQRHHRTLFANRGQAIQEICASCNVQIRFPERASPRGGGDGRPPRQSASPAAATDEHPPPGPEGDAAPDEPRPEDTVVILGRQENCERAKELLMAQIPITEEVAVPFDYHRFLIGKSGADLRKLQSDFNVHVTIPPKEEQRDTISVNGSPDNVRKAVEAIKDKVAEFDEEAKDKELRSFVVQFDIPEEYCSRVIGPKGKTISAIRERHDVQIKMPTPGSDSPSKVTVTGYEEKAKAAMEEIKGLVAELEALFSQEITLDCRVHPRIIGQRGKAIRKIMDDYRVEIRFPRNNQNPNLVTVIGGREDDVYDCIDYLRNLEEEYLQDVTESYRHPEYEMRQQRSEAASRGQSGLVVSNAPWNSGPPDTTNMEDFPTVGGGPGAAAAAAPAWGPKRY